MRINKVEGSTFTESGDINNPTTYNQIQKKFYNRPNFWGGFAVGFLSSLAASIVFYFLTK